MTMPRQRNQKKTRYSRRIVHPYRGVPLLKGYEQGRQGIEEVCDDELAPLDYDQRMLRIAQSRDRDIITARTPLSRYDGNEEQDEDDIDFDDSEMDFE